MRLATSPGYDRLTVALHWATAVVVVGLWATAQSIDLFPRGPARYPMRSTHIVLGVLFGGLLLWRLWWRANGARRLPAASAGWAGVASRGLHVLLYALLLSEVLLGVANTWIRGDHIYTLFQIEPLDPGNLELRKVVGTLHHWGGNLILGLAGLHAVAALFHHFVLKDGVLRRMTFRKQ